MAIATAYYSVNMDTASTWYGVVTIATATHIQIADGDYVQNYYGSGFTYNEYTVTGGTVTSTDYYEFGSKVYQITGGSYSAVTVANYVNSGNIQGLFSYIFAGDDQFNGSPYADAVNAYAGNDLINGNGGNDLLKGGAGDDVLNGGAGTDTLDGGSGSDSMNGSTGNDTYIVDNTGDIVTELPAQGIDLVQSSISFTLTPDFENLTLTGTATINGTGNGMDNVLTGNIAANILSGLAGADTLYGGDGNDTLYGGNGVDFLNGGAGADVLKGGRSTDTYVVDNIGDIVTEYSGEGVDLVQSSVTYTLTPNVEKLTLTGSLKINGTGNGLNNTLQGNSVANKLVGLIGADTLMGGAGNDTLLGGAGNDVLNGGLGNDFFVFNTAVNATTNIDTIKDYSAAADTIRLENSIFTSLTTTGVLSADNFVQGTTALDANDYLLYDSSTGALYYDADANGSGDAVQFATVYSASTTPATLSAAEFVVI